MTLTIAGLILIGFGLLYVRRPAIYRRGLWMKTSLAVRYLSEAQYRAYIKGIGYVFMLVGIVLVLWEQVLGR